MFAEPKNLFALQVLLIEGHSHFHHLFTFVSELPVPLVVHEEMLTGCSNSLALQLLRAKSTRPLYPTAVSSPASQIRPPMAWFRLVSCRFSRSM